MSTRFEWNNKKADSNIKKHQVGFEEAITVFGDPLAVIFDDENCFTDELREIIIGHSTSSRLLVCFAERDQAIRIFSARLSTKKERKDYEENVQF